MALSDFDTLAFDAAGKCCNGSCENDVTSTLEIYKNWAYLANKNMQIKDSGYTGDTIATIYEGHINIAGFDIQAKRGKQNSIYVVACYGDWPDRKYFGGIGCYGFADTIRLVLKELGREDERDAHWSQSVQYRRDDSEVHSIRNMITEEVITYENKPEYEEFIGVTSDTLADYFDWCTSIDVVGNKFEDWVEKCKESRPVRCNQGDSYFADNLGTDAQCTTVGEKPAEPMVMRLIRGTKT